VEADPSANRYDKLTRDTLLDVEDHRLVRIESVQNQRRVDRGRSWLATHGRFSATYSFSYA